MMAASPIGATLSVFTSTAGGRPAGPGLGPAWRQRVDTFGLGRGLRTEGPPSVSAVPLGHQDDHQPSRPRKLRRLRLQCLRRRRSRRRPIGKLARCEHRHSRSLEENEDILIDASHGLQSRLPGAGPFHNVTTGMRPDEETKYLWTVDERGVNLALEKTPFPTPRRNVVHTKPQCESIDWGRGVVKCGVRPVW
jgi:hypothetical protein